MTAITQVVAKEFRESKQKADVLNSSFATGLSTHLLVEMWQAPFSSLANAQIIGDILEQAASDCNNFKDTSDLKVNAYQFDPYGVSATVSNSMLHILIHTWPEKGYAALDILAREQSHAHKILENLKSILNPGHVEVIEVVRGQLLDMEDT